MRTLAETPAAVKTAHLTAKSPLPREHGAWAVLLVPFATAVGISSKLTPPVGLLLVSVLCFFMARATAAGTAEAAFCPPHHATRSPTARRANWLAQVRAPVRPKGSRGRNGISTISGCR